MFRIDLCRRVIIPYLFKKFNTISKTTLFSFLLVCYTNKNRTGGIWMADQEKWDLSREEIERRLQKLKADPKQHEKTRGGRSSVQGVKLLYIRDYLYHHA